MEFGSIRMAGCESSPWYSSNPNCVCYCRAGAALYRVFLSWSRRNKLLVAAPDPTVLMLDITDFDEPRFGGGTDQKILAPSGTLVFFYIYGQL